MSHGRQSATASGHPEERLRILHVWADPRRPSDAAIDVQIGRLRLELDRFSADIDYQDQPACSREDLLRRLNAFRPHVLHISGHGDPQGGIALMHPLGGPLALTKSDLAALLRDRDELELLVLDCCYGLVGVEALSGAVRAVIGARERIREPYPIAFSIALYHSIACGRPLRACMGDAVVAAAERHAGGGTFELWPEDGADTHHPLKRSRPRDPAAPSDGDRLRLRAVRSSRRRGAALVAGVCLMVAFAVGVGALAWVPSEPSPAHLHRGERRITDDTPETARALPTAREADTVREREPSGVAPVRSAGKTLRSDPRPAPAAVTVDRETDPPGLLARVLLYEQPPEPPDPYPPPELGLEVVRKTSGDTGWTRVRDGEALSDRDDYRILVWTGTPGFLYVVQVDSSGKVEWLFPANTRSAHSSGANPVPGAAVVAVPERATLYLDQVEGAEHVIAVLSVTRWTALEDALRAPSPRMEPEALGSDPRSREVTRGVGGHRPIAPEGGAPQTFQGAIEGATPAMDSAVFFQSRGRFVRVGRWFRHVAHPDAVAVELEPGSAR